MLADPQFFLPTDTDILTQVQNAIDGGANIIYTNTVASGPALIAGTLVDLGMEDDIKLAGFNWVMDTSVGIWSGQRVLKPDGLPSTDGMFGSMPFLWWTELSQPGGAVCLSAVHYQRAQSQPSKTSPILLSWGVVDSIIETYIAHREPAWAALMLLPELIFAPLSKAMDYEVLGGLYHASIMKKACATAY